MPLLLLACSGLAHGQSDSVASLDDLLEQVRETRVLEAQGDAERERRFLEEKASQRNRLESARNALAEEQLRSELLQQRFDDNERALVELERRLTERSGDLTELFAVARQVAGETRALLADSLVSSQFRGRREILEDLAESRSQPGIGALERLWFVLQEEMTESGRVASYRTAVIAADGGEVEQRVTRVGMFNAVSEGRFLRYAPETETLQELQRQPAERHRRMAAELESASSGLLPMLVDPSRGTVLSLLVEVPDLLERIRQGRLVGYVIIGLFGVGLLIAVERLIHLSVVGRRIKKQLGSEIPNRKNPLGRILATYQENRHLDTETLELKFDESILEDSPRLQRGLQTLRILSVIAPLLGLLGTVTGLIETFQSITLFGAGDPRLMAGGISQALVTTVLGLLAAIPLILLHSLLASKSRRLVSLLEAQSAGIVARHAERYLGHVAAA